MVVFVNKLFNSYKLTIFKNLIIPLKLDEKITLIIEFTLFNFQAHGMSGSETKIKIENKLIRSQS